MSSSCHCSNALRIQMLLEANKHALDGLYRPKQIDCVILSEILQLEQFGQVFLVEFFDAGFDVFG